jgi:VWFA-related protein
MSRAIIVLFTVAASAGLLFAQQDTAFRARLHMVSVYATVVDRAGRLIPDLGKNDFDVFDNGKRQDLALFTNDVQPITIVIMLDRSGSMVRNFERVRDAAEHLVAQLLDVDKARLGSFADRVQIDPAGFTSDKNDLIRILHEDLQDSGPTPLWNATAIAMTALARQEGRRVVLVFTDGYDNPGGGGPNVSFDEVRERSRTEDVMVYAIGFSDRCDSLEDDFVGVANRTRWQGRGGPGRGPGGGYPIPGWPGGIGGAGRVPPRIPIVPGRVPPPRPDPSGSSWNRARSTPCTEAKPDPDLKELAADGGGGYFELRGTDNLGSTFARVADELHHQYLLAFTATNLDGKTHTIEVRVRQSDLMVRARKGYVATPDR